MKKFLAICLSCLIIFSLVGCDNQTTTISVNTELTDELSNNIFGKTALVMIGDDLWYDSTTRIVYFWNGCLNYGYYSTCPTPYYAPNGLPYRYIPETNTFEEIAIEAN